MENLRANRHARAHELGEQADETGDNLMPQRSGLKVSPRGFVAPLVQSGNPPDLPVWRQSTKERSLHASVPSGRTRLMEKRFECNSPVVIERGYPDVSARGREAGGPSGASGRTLLAPQGRGRLDHSERGSGCRRGGDRRRPARGRGGNRN